MLPDFERVPKSQKRRGRRRSHRASMHNTEPLRIQEGRSGEVVDSGSHMLREAEEMRDAVERVVFPGFEGFSNNVFQEENFLSGHTHPEVYEEMNEVIHSKDAAIQGWMDNINAPYFLNAYETRSSSAQIYTEAALRPGGYFETVERRVKTSKNLDCDYATEFVLDIKATLERSYAHRREVAQYGYEGQINLVPEMEALAINKTPRVQRRRSGSVGAKDASEYKQSRGIRKR
ncbi:uncharacterized protein DFL_003068 [Arthrobotrys flagrans]|uniref:Uncharacterized protein n=1 Tax=Arthrobotrys flagrans TaxID=97331 RepID=A0A437ACC1_ARTFL|nr:hypothetical protein DFL_003068 [Arthrobotrys flagrans]